MRRLTLEEIDPKTSCIAREFSIEVASVNSIGVRGATEESIAFMQYDLSTKTVNHLRLTFGLDIPKAKHRYRIRAWSGTDQLSYRIHTGRELAMMLSGIKPLAYFARSSTDRFSDVCDQPFAKFVASKKIHAGQFSIGEGSGEVIYHTFTLPRERWRAEALKLLLETATKCSWSEGMERMLGSLLGYTDAETNEFLSKTKTWGVSKTAI